MVLIRAEKDWYGKRFKQCDSKTVHIYRTTLLMWFAELREYSCVPNSKPLTQKCTFPWRQYGSSGRGQCHARFIKLSKYEATTQRSLSAEALTLRRPDLCQITAKKGLPFLVWYQWSTLPKRIIRYWIVSEHSVFIIHERYSFAQGALTTVKRWRRYEGGAADLLKHLSNLLKHIFPIW